MTQVASLRRSGINGNSTLLNGTRDTVHESLLFGEVELMETKDLILPHPVILGSLLFGEVELMETAHAICLGDPVQVSLLFGEVELMETRVL